MTAEDRDAGPWTPARGTRLLLGLAAVAVAFAAADTYVVVLALPEMMAGAGLAVDELRSAELTGVFYEDSDPMTYVVTFEDYGTEKDITAP